jgi:hypothetical protein
MVKACASGEGFIKGILSWRNAERGCILGGDCLTKAQIPLKRKEHS